MKNLSDAIEISISAGRINDANFGIKMQEQMESSLLHKAHVNSNPTRRILTEKKKAIGRLLYPLEELDSAEFQDGLDSDLEEALYLLVMEDCVPNVEEILHLYNDLLSIYDDALKCNHQQTIEKIEEFVR